MIFRCPYPKFDSLRVKYSTTLLSSFPQPLEAGALQRFLEQPPALVAGFVCSAGGPPPRGSGPSSVAAGFADVVNSLVYLQRLRTTSLTTRIFCPPPNPAP